MLPGSVPPFVLCVYISMNSDIILPIIMQRTGAHHSMHSCSFIQILSRMDSPLFQTQKQTLPGRQLTNPQEILALMSKRKKQTLEY